MVKAHFSKPKSGRDFHPLSSFVRTIFNSSFSDKVTLIDLTGDTVTEETLLRGYTAHRADGTQIVGTAFADYPERYSFLDPLQDSNGEKILDNSNNVLQGETVYKKV